MSPKSKQRNNDNHKQGTILSDEEHLKKMEVKVGEINLTGDFKKNPVYIYYDWCKKCGICSSFCPTGALGRKLDGSPYVPHPEKCVHCELCDKLCPDFAITGAKR